MSTETFGRETKYQKVRAELESLANRLGPEGKLPSVRQLAVTMDTSINTLMLALEDLEHNNIVCRRPGKGIFVSPSRVKSIWLICDSEFFSQGHSPFWDVLLQEARLRAARNNAHLSMHFTLPEGVPDSVLHQALIDEINAGRVHGVLGVGLRRRTAHWILEQGVPYTAFAGWAPYVVNLDHQTMIELGVQTLAERGCQRIGFWKPIAPPPDPDEKAPTRCELTGYFEQAMAARGLLIDQTLIQNHWPPNPEIQRESLTQQGYRTARTVFASSEAQPGGILVTNDVMTQGALLAMAQLGIRPGHDVLIATHSNKGTPMPLENEADVIRIEFDPVELVGKLLQMLETLMDGQIPGTTTVHMDDVDIELVQPQLVVAQ